MSHNHVARILADFNTGVPAHLLANRVEDFGMPRAEVMNLSDEWSFYPEGSYCPVSDTPSWVRAAYTPAQAVYTQGDACCICFCNGMDLACWLLSK